MLKRIQIKGYKSLRDLDVRLGPLSVLFGPNAAGKSNFLDALQLLARLATSRSVKEAFEPPYRGNPLESFSFTSDGVRDLLARDFATFSLEADIELSQAAIDRVEREVAELRRPAGAKHEEANAGPTIIRERFLRYKVSIEMIPRSGILRVVDECLSALRQDGELKTKRTPFLGKYRNKIHLRMEKQAHPMEFDPQLDHTILSRPLYAPHHPHVVAARYEMASWLFFYFEPRERMRSPNPVKEVRHLGLMGEELAAFLNTLKAVNPRQFHAVEKALQLIVPSASGVEIAVNDIGEVEFRVMEGNTPVPARLLSEGTLRVLGMLAAGSSPIAPGLIGLEEPENGVHPRRIELIAEYLQSRARSGRTQLIVTTHSPRLLDLLPDDALFVVQRTSEGTLIKPYSSWGGLAREHGIERGLTEAGELASVSERVIRGDFDA